jgi:hypothetical protein
MFRVAIPALQAEKARVRDLSLEAWGPHPTRTSALPRAFSRVVAACAAGMAARNILPARSPRRWITAWAHIDITRAAGVL